MPFKFYHKVFLKSTQHTVTNVYVYRPDTHVCIQETQTFIKMAQ